MAGSGMQQQILGLQLRTVFQVQDDLNQSPGQWHWLSPLFNLFLWLVLRF